MSSTRRRSFESVLAVIGVSIPFLVYFSAPRFADEMRDPYTMTVRYGLNPIKIVMGNLKDIRPFLDLGNIRPLGRIAYSFEFVYSKAIADTLAVPLPTIHAVVRTAALWAAVAAVVVLWRAVETSGRHLRPQLTRSIGLVACAAAVATLATWSYQPLVFFPTQGLLSVALVCLASAFTLRFSNQGGWRLAGCCASLGAVCACFYDLAYVVVVAVPVSIVGLRVLQKRSGLLRASWSSCIPLIAGFSLVFLPIRVMIARACAEQACYSGSELAVTGRAAPTLAGRLLSAVPQSYWSMGWEQPTVAGALVAIAVGCGVGLAAMWATRQEHDGVEPGVEAEHGIEDGADRGADLAGADEVSAPPAPGPSIVVTVVMLTAWAAAASMSALSVSQQRIGFDPQTPWRDGIFGFLAIATLLWALIEHVSRSGSGQALRAAVAAVALLAGVQFALNTGTIAQTRSISPNMLYGRIDDLFASPPDENQTCDLAHDLYDLAQQPGRRYYTTALLESLKRLKPLEACPAYRYPLPLEEWHRRQLGDLDQG
ncbi:MAG: hypothetical protein WAT32_18265 [Candidatus Microthrix parvicella]